MLPFLVAALVISAVAAIVDHRTGHIPNWLTHGTIVLAPLAHAGRALLRHANPGEIGSQLGWSIAGAALCFVVAVLLYMVNATGGGDVKLFAGLGALLQPSMGFDVVVASFGAFVVLSAVSLARKGRLGAMLKNAGRLVARRFGSAQDGAPEDIPPLNEMRMGPAIFAGVLIVATLRLLPRH